MSKRSLALLLVVATVAVFAGASVAYGGSIQGSGAFIVDPPVKGGATYSGEIVITADIVNTPNLPAWAVPPNYTTTIGYNEVLATLTFVMKLSPKRGLPMTFSGIGKRKLDPADPANDTRTIYFNLPGDYSSSYKILGQATYDFVKEQFPGGLLTSVVEINDNVTDQLMVGGDGLGTATPFHMWLEVEVVQP